jgi:hypothetical protein
MELPDNIESDGNASYGGGPRSRNRKGVHVRLPDDILARLEAEADARVVSTSWLVTRLVTEGLERLRPVEDFVLTLEPRKDHE